MEKEHEGETKEESEIKEAKASWNRQGQVESKVSWERQVGETGLKGEKGDTGTAGMKGAKGEPGEPIAAPTVDASPAKMTVNESKTVFSSVQSSAILSLCQHEVKWKGIQRKFYQQPQLGS